MSIDNFLAEAMRTLPFLYLFYILFSLFSAVISLAIYILQGIAFMKIAQKVGVPNGWMAFIPFANLYLYGKIAEESDRRHDPEKQPKKWSSILLISTIALSVALILLVPVVVIVEIFIIRGTTAFPAVLFGGLLFAFLIFAAAIAVIVLRFMAMYRLYRLMAGQHAPWMLILSIFVDLAPTVILCVLGFSSKFPLKTEEAPAAPIYTDVQ